MATTLDEIVAFPENFPPVTTGVLLLRNNVLITGHENGFVIRWDIQQKKKYSELYNCKSPVRTISSSDDNEIAVGCSSGGLVVIPLDKPKEMEIIRKPTYDKYGRVWRTIWSGKDKLIMTSTYGELRSFDRIGPHRWETSEMQGHSNSIFAIGSSNGKYLLTGDYSGNILIWEDRDNNFEKIQRLNIPQTVQDVHWFNDEVFAVINRSGRIYLFERESENANRWQAIIEIDIATSTGNCVNITDDGRTVFAGTSNEVIQFDRDSQQTDQISITESKRIFSHGNTIYVLTSQGLHSFERKNVEVRKDLVKYRFAKISLLGHTQTGKTTLCNYIMFNTIKDAKSTFGKRVWNWILPKDNSVEKRIVLSDHGGQEAVLETFLPFLKDSDLFLIFFKQIDKMTFEKACRILDLVRKNVSVDTKIMFVQTFIDHKMNEIPEIKIQQLKSKGEIIDNIKISPKEKTGLGEFKKRILDAIPWASTRIMIKSPYTEGISQALTYVQEKGYPAVAYGKFKTLYQDLIGDKISDRHLRFLLKDYTNQGIIEYYPEITDLLIFNDERYNKLMTNIPIYAEHKKGIVSIEELKEKFRDSAYLRIIDEVYANSGITIRNGNLRIFPDKLTKEPIEIPKFHKERLKEPQQIRLPYRFVEIGRLVEALSEIKLQCIMASQREGIFAWGDRAYIYYSFAESGDNISGRYIQCTYYTGGKNEPRRKRLVNAFNSIIGKLYGILPEKPSGTTVKKKDPIELSLT